MAEAVAFIVLGLFAGFIASTLGLGGGFIYVPMLVVFFTFDQHTAQGTSLAVIVPTAVVAAYLHSRRGRVRWNTALLMGAGGVVGGVAGSFLALRLPADVLRRLFAVLLVLVAIRMFNR
jgi:uncharacterized membrane protein YfcA